MDGKRFIVGTATGGIVYFVLGVLLYAVLLGDFFESNMGSATGVQKEEIQYWPLLIGNLAFAALLTYAIQNWVQASTFREGARTGALIGLLVTIGYDMIQYDTTNIMNMTGTLADILVFTLMSSIAGGVIALVAAGKSE